MDNCPFCKTKLEYYRDAVINGQTVRFWQCSHGATIPERIAE